MITLTAILDAIADSPFGTLTWVDAIDILGLAWLVYRGLLLIRGTRAMQSLIGLALVGAVWVLSDVLGLATLHAVLDSLVVYVVIAMLILFQEDIRSALARAGGTVFARSSQASDAALLEEIVRATFELARRKIGALIAIQRDASLDPYEEGAHEMESIVTTELLQAIFHPTSPLHDGAVVIADGRIAAAGVFLPISLAKDLSKAYGTRHRAAIGITQATDALVVLVSEERGTVAIVEGGQIVPIADADELREKLQERIGQRGKLVVEPVVARTTTQGDRSNEIPNG